VQISLDKQVVSRHCPGCGVDFTVVQGSVYDGDEPCGLYLIGLHGHSPQGRLAHLAIAVLDRTGEEPHPYAAALDVIALPDQLGFSAVDWGSSPWRGERYLGEMLDREQALTSPHRPTFFHIAEHVVRDLSEVQAYFG
jgi:hypothetical protein